MLVTDAFFGFFLETLKLMGEQINQRAVIGDLRYFQEVMLAQATNFRSFRAAANLLLCGYPLDGYSLLRDLKDRAIFLGAIMLGISRWPDLQGRAHLEGSEPRELTEAGYIEIHNRRKAEEGRVHKLMLAMDSGLDEETQKNLDFWERLFHVEVHGSRLSSASEGGLNWLKGEAPLLIEPQPVIKSATMYTNRSDEVAWMLLRTFPFIQLKPGAFGDQWAARWHLLDAAFRAASDALADMGKPIGKSIVKLLDSKFPFVPETTGYVE
jgi:hypothetical protein